MNIQFLKTFFILLVLQAIFFATGQNGAIAQAPKAKLTEESIIKDSSGQVYNADLWKKLLMTGYYTLRAAEPSNEKSAFYLVRLSEEEREKRLSSSPKPKETKNFTTGKEVSNFSITDIDGKKIKLKELKGKVIVLNFWFINCPPCRAEMPELNKLVADFKDSTNVVFLAIALDERNALKDFFKKQPFYYTIIDDGRTVAQQYGITSYPTHLIIDQEGKAYFHTSGGGATISYWLRKSINELIVINKPKEKVEN